MVQNYFEKHKNMKIKKLNLLKKLNFKFNQFLIEKKIKI